MDRRCYHRRALALTRRLYMQGGDGQGSPDFPGMSDRDTSPGAFRMDRQGGANGTMTVLASPTGDGNAVSIARTAGAAGEYIGYHMGQYGAGKLNQFKLPQDFRLVCEVYSVIAENVEPKIYALKSGGSVLIDGGAGGWAGYWKDYVLDFTIAGDTYAVAVWRIRGNINRFYYIRKVRLYHRNGAGGRARIPHAIAAMGLIAMAHRPPEVYQHGQRIMTY